MFSQAHLFSPAYPSFAALGGVTSELQGGDSSRHKSKVSPPWVCAKCAKKHPSEMGCGETVDEGVVIPDGSDEDFYRVRTTSEVDDVLGCGIPHQSREEQLGCDKCKEGQRKKRKKAAAAAAIASNGRNEAAFYTPYNMHGGYPVANMGHRHRFQVGQSVQELTCPTSPAPVDPTLNCMRDARGNAVCSNGLFYPPGCPHTPPDSYFTPGISPDEVVGGILQAKIPPPRSGGVASSLVGSSSTTTALVAGAGAIGVGALLFMLFR